MSEALVERPQEGAQVLAQQIANHIVGTHAGTALGPASGSAAGQCVLKGPTFGWAAWRLLASRQFSSVTYTPQHGLTFAAILRAWCMLLVARPAFVEIVVLQVHLERWDFIHRAARRLRYVAATTEQLTLLDERGLAVELLFPRVAPGKISAHRSRQDARAALGWDDQPRFLHVGHARPGRNLLALDPLTAAGELVLVLSGYGEEDQAALPSSDQVRVFRGYLDSLADLYRAADVYVFPTVSSADVIGLPMSVFEALANGTPVVARRSTSLERWADHPNLFLCSDDAELVRVAVQTARERADYDSPVVAGNLTASTDCKPDLTICRATLEG